MLAALEERRPNWQRELSGAVLIQHTPAVHTLTSAVSLDVAWCRPVGPPAALDVIRLSAIRRRGVALARPRAPVMLLACTGAFERWGLRAGDRLEIKGG